MKLPFSLDANESVARTIHRHWIDIIPAVLSAGLLILGGLALAYAYARYPQYVLLPGIIVWPVIILMLAVGALVFLVGYFVFTRNVLILTNVHMVQVEQSGLFSRRVSQLSLTKVQDVSGTRPGFLATMLDFGDLEVQTAGEEEKFIFHNVAHPEQLADECLESHEACMRELAASGQPVAPE